MLELVELGPRIAPLLEKEVGAAIERLDIRQARIAGSRWDRG